jgi:hypothetical protein
MLDPPKRTSFPGTPYLASLSIGDLSIIVRTSIRIGGTLKRTTRFGTRNRNGTARDVGKNDDRLPDRFLLVAFEIGAPGAGEVTDGGDDTNMKPLKLRVFG